MISDFLSIFSYVFFLINLTNSKLTYKSLKLIIIYSERQDKLISSQIKLLEIDQLSVTVPIAM